MYYLTLVDEKTDMKKLNEILCMWSIPLAPKSPIFWAPKSCSLSRFEGVLHFTVSFGKVSLLMDHLQDPSYSQSCFERKHHENKIEQFITFSLQSFAQRNLRMKANLKYAI